MEESKRVRESENVLYRLIANTLVTRLVTNWRTTWGSNHHDPIVTFGVQRGAWKFETTTLQWLAKETPYPIVTAPYDCHVSRKPTQRPTMIQATSPMCNILTIICSGRKQPCILHLLLFPMKQQHCLYSVCQSSTYAHIISAVSPSAVSPLSHMLLLMCSHACQVRCSSGKPTPVTLHSHCFQTYRFMYHSSHAHHKIPHLFNHILTCS